MINKYETKDLHINADIGGKKKGDVVKVQVDKEGTIAEKYWRDRLKDSKIDGCVGFKKQKASSTSNQTNKES